MLRRREVKPRVKKPNYLYSLPDEITGIVLSLAYPDFNTSRYDCRDVFRLRRSSKTLRRVVDVRLLGAASRLNSRFVRHISGEAFALFTGIKELTLRYALDHAMENRIQKMTGLSQLTLCDGCPVTDDFLSGLTQLKTLKIYYNEEDSHLTGSFLSSLTNLTRLAIPDDNIQIKPDHFSCLTGLTSLNMECCESIEAEDLASFGQSLRSINIMGSDIELIDLVPMQKLEVIITDMRSDYESEDILRGRGVDICHTCIRGSYLR